MRSSVLWQPSSRHALHRYRSGTRLPLTVYSAVSITHDAVTQDSQPADDRGHRIATQIVPSAGDGISRLDGVQALPTAATVTRVSAAVTGATGLANAQRQRQQPAGKKSPSRRAPMDSGSPAGSALTD